ncbi:hypothetical protein FEP54_01843 [Burkholderia multivorans]|nr:MULTISPECIES: hypothetical protein [Burkholderia]MDR8923130.1 hypothetical protein [Burkholderia multivorans]MDR8967703.1 hypothetical protein [Burkholderia multivorans]MDR8989654.1 hypothetical protein [Burkholderia multivorans]MDR9021033.1 hypothetical protein [Burkholderia multivorans]MDR9027460.1 hypothetical protein [Burkholderia multivorans]
MNPMLKRVLSLVALGPACAAADSRGQDAVMQGGVLANAFDVARARAPKGGDEDVRRRTHRHLQFVPNGSAR